MDVRHDKDTTPVDFGGSDNIIEQVMDNFKFKSLVSALQTGVFEPAL
jgi:hypothetical protein